MAARSTHGARCQRCELSSASRPRPLRKDSFHLAFLLCRFVSTISDSKPKHIICTPLKMNKTERMAPAKRVTIPVWRLNEYARAVAEAYEYECKAGGQKNNKWIVVSIRKPLSQAVQNLPPSAVRLLIWLSQSTHTCGKLDAVRRPRSRRASSSSRTQPNRAGF